MAIRVTNTLDMSREMWLRFRRKGLGGSDIGALMGFNKWKSPMDVYLDKMGELPDQDEISEAAYFGNRLENFVAEEFMLKTGLKVRRNNFLLQHDEYPFLLANVDRVIVASGDDGPGILECKTASEYLKQSWNEDEVPPSYFLQVQHYLAVTGYKYGWIASLIGGNKFYHKRIERDDELIEQMIEVASNFWNNHVVPGIPPEWDGSAASSDLLDKMYPNAQKNQIVLPSKADELINEFEKAKENEKFWKGEKDKYANQLKGFLEDNEVGATEDRKVFWKNQSRSSIDSKKLREEEPEIYNKYIKTSTFRKFEVK
jgi:putative phage-type endonuclease